MFTGIIEATGVIKNIISENTNLSFTIESEISHELKVDQSIAHNGVCLTVEKVKSNQHTVTAITETINKTNVQFWQVGAKINLERCLPFHGRIDGHIVQGHVDATGICIEKKEVDGSWLFSFSFDQKFAALVIEKGSICINGISLTCFNVDRNRLSVAIIPYTYNHTNIQFVDEGDIVNLEFDIIGKYLNRFRDLQLH
jgi:riboflavin synthase